MDTTLKLRKTDDKTVSHSQISSPRGRVSKLRRVSVLFRAAFNLTVRPLRAKARAATRTAGRIGAAAEPFLHRNRLPRVAGVCILAAAVILLMSTALVGIGLQVYIDGDPVGFVLNRGEFYQVIENVEAKASVILGYPYRLSLDVDYKLEMYNRRMSLDTAAVEQAMFNGIGEVSQMYVLKVDGEVLAANQSRDALEGVLSGIIDQTLAGETETATASFAQNVNVELSYTASENEASISDIETMLTSNVVDQSMYTAAEDDTFESIAARHGMSSDALLALNPDVSPDQLSAGDQLVVGEAVPLMSVLVTKREEYEIAVEHETEYVYSSTMWDGDRVVTTKGSDGVVAVVADVQYTNGKESSREIISENFLVEPVTEIVTMGTRNFILPFPGYRQISSRFGWRIYRGRNDNHTGLDFAGSYGSKVVASYAGTVEYSGWKGNYGNCIIINHGGGYKTLYAHNSKLAVKVGAKVEQGQTVAYVGSTGKSTGNHCHFEIIINGTPVNPWKYLFG